MTYEYKARMVRAVDGDTVDVIIDLGFGIMFGNEGHPRRIRIADIDTPEMNASDTEEREKAKIAKEFVARYEGELVKINTRKTRKGKERTTFGRYVADISVFSRDDPDTLEDLAELLCDEGLAERWDG